MRRPFLELVSMVAVVACLVLYGGSSRAPAIGASETSPTLTGDSSYPFPFASPTPDRYSRIIRCYPSRLSKYDESENYHVGIRGIELGMGRQRVEQLLGGALSHNKLGQNLSGYYTLCYECRLKSELTPDDQCSVHADSHILALSLDREGYVDSLLGDSLEVDGVRFDKGQKIGEIVGVLNLRKTYAPESFMLPWGQQVFLNSADGKLVSVKVTE